MKPTEFIDVVEELNNGLDSELYENGIGYTYSTNGYIDVVKFCGYVLYNSEDICEEEVEDIGGLKPYLVKERIKFINMLTKTGIY